MLASGEPGWETDTNKLKIGDGSTAWNSLAYFAGGSGIVTLTSSGATITVTNPSGPTANVDLPNTGVTAGSYGDGTHVGSFTVDAKGRITAASTVTITGGSITGLSWGGFFESYYTQGEASGATTVQNGNIKLVRVLIPETGTLDTIGWYVGTTSGNLSVAVYDTGQTTAGTVTRLFTTGAIAASGSGTWQTASPGLSVHAGDQQLWAISADNNTLTIANATVGTASETILPSGFFGTPAAARTLCSFIVGGSHPAPATIVDANLLTGNIHPPCFIGHIT